MRKPEKEGILFAFEKVREVVPPTPVLPLEVRGTRIWCKCESDQPIGAFKLRGAWHRLTALSDAERERGVVAFSSGNHAQGVAWAAQRLGIEATIVMPSNAPQIKVDGTQALGAKIVFYDRKTEDRVQIANQLAAERGSVIVPAFDDPYVIEGQGSIGPEAVEQLGFEPDLVVAPCGGGGLAAGLALALPKARIATAEPIGWDMMAQSLAAGHLVDAAPDAPMTICDALQPPRVSPLTFEVLAARRAQSVSVSDEDVKAAVLLAWVELGKRIEPGGAAALAAVLAGKVEPIGETLIILSGGNVDAEAFARIVAE